MYEPIGGPGRVERSEGKSGVGTGGKRKVLQSKDAALEREAGVNNSFALGAEDTCESRVVVGDNSVIGTPENGRVGVEV